MVFCLTYYLYFYLKKNRITFKFFRNNFKKITVAAACSVYSYFPAVYGFTVGKVAVVAALREVSILFASLYGLIVLKEKGGYLAFFSALLILCGCVVIKLF